MKPLYTDGYRRAMDDSKVFSVTATVDSPFKKLVAEVAQADHTSSSHLAFEGLTRVLEDRFNDPTFIEIVTVDPESYPLIAEQLKARDTPAKC